MKKVLVDTENLLGLRGLLFDKRASHPRAVSCLTSDVYRSTGYLGTPPISLSTLEKNVQAKLGHTTQSTPLSPMYGKLFYSY